MDGNYRRSANGAPVSIESVQERVHRMVAERNAETCRREMEWLDQHGDTACVRTSKRNGVYVASFYVDGVCVRSGRSLTSLQDARAQALMSEDEPTRPG